MKGKIVLETGQVFEGNIISGSGTVAGKLIFDTRVVGYEKVLTSPEYAGKLVCFTYPLIGNYGICREDTETGMIYPSGIIISEYSEVYSNFRAECSLKEFLKGRQVVMIEGIDTQNLTEILRGNSGIWAGIAPWSAGLNSVLKHIDKYKYNNSGTSFKKYTGEKNSFPKKDRPYLAVLNLGLKKSETAMLKDAGLESIIVDSDFPNADGILKSAAGIYVSSGSEDLRVIEKSAGLLKNILGNVPVFASVSGHLAVGLACGAEVSKGNVNHYGVNQPVMDAKNRKCHITEQAHSLVLNKGSVSRIIRYVNINDQTVEGLEDREKKVFTAAFQITKDNFKEFFTIIKDRTCRQEETSIK